MPQGGAPPITYEEYHPYGSTAFHTARSGEVSAKRYRYTGKEKDEGTGLYYHGARYYAAWLGRWTSTDPAELVDGLNLYRYSRDNPVRYADSSGTQAEDHIKDLLQFIRNQAGFEAGAANPPLLEVSKAGRAEAVRSGIRAHAQATDLINRLKKVEGLAFKGIERIYSEVRVVKGVVEQIAGKPGGPKGALNADIIVTKVGQGLKKGQSLLGGVADLVADFKYGAGKIASKFKQLGSPVATINAEKLKIPKGAAAAAAPAAEGSQAAQAATATTEAASTAATASEAVKAESTASKVSALASKTAGAAKTESTLGRLAARGAQALKPLAPAAKVLGKVAGPLAVVATGVQVATAKTTEEKVSAGISVVSTGLLLSGNPVAAAAGGGLAAGELIENTLDVSSYSAAAGMKVNEGLQSLGVNEDVAFWAGAAATVAATPAAISVAAVDKGLDLAKSGWDYAASFF